MIAQPVPVSLITGFLGSGKTTLLNRLLNSGRLKDAALIINEFGDVGIDHLLIETADEGIVELSDGCLCCTIRGDLIDTLSRIVNRDPQPRRIIIETTGLADPAPILHAVMGHPVLSERLQLEGVITVVDAVNGENTLDNHQEAVKQVAVADRLVLSKTDLATAQDNILPRLKKLNPSAKIFYNKYDDLDLEKLLNCRLYDPNTKSADVRNWLNFEAVKHHHDHSHKHEVNRHDSRIRAFTFATKAMVDAAELADFIDILRTAHGPNLLRVKGIFLVRENPEHPVVIHGVQQIFHPPATLPGWFGNDKETRLVMITRDLPRQYVAKLFDAFTRTVQVDTADHSALTDNPLLVPGKSF